MLRLQQTIKQVLVLRNLLAGRLAQMSSGSRKWRRKVVRASSARPHCKQLAAKTQNGASLSLSLNTDAIALQSVKLLRSLRAMRTLATSTRVCATRNIHLDD